MMLSLGTLCAVVRRSCRLRFIATSLLFATLAAATAQAELVIEPVFNRGEGTGPAENAVGVRQAVNGIQAELGIEPAWTAQPGEVFSYVTGDPRKPELDDLLFYNDTDFDITGFSLAIIGTGTDTDDPRTIVRARAQLMALRRRRRRWSDSLGHLSKLRNLG